MKHLPTVAGILLSLLFLLASIPVLFNLIPPDKMPKPPTHEAEMFMVAFGTTGYLKFVKIVELIGAILVAIPKTRNFGLLALGPVIINILAYHVFLTKPADVFEPMIVAIVVLTLYLLWVGRQQFAALKN
jgi:putative oxidoreductase